MKEYDEVVVKLSDGSELAGKVRLNGRSRVCEVLNDEEAFLVVKDVVGQGHLHKDFLVINKRHIMLIGPGSEQTGRARAPHAPGN